MLSTARIISTRHIANYLSVSRGLRAATSSLGVTSTLLFSTMAADKASKTHIDVADYYGKVNAWRNLHL
jgi:hypothetical protein